MYFTQKNEREHFYFFISYYLLLYQELYILFICKYYMANDEMLRKLMKDAQDGNSASYQELLQQITIILKKYLATRIISEPDREDIMQDILIAIHNSRHTYLVSKPFYPWMYAIAKNVLVKFYKKFQRVSEISIDIEMEEIPNPEKIKIDEKYSDQVKAMLSIIQTLPSRQKQILIMLKFDKISIREIANKLNLSEGNVKVVAHRAYETIRKRLKDEY